MAKRFKRTNYFIHPSSQLKYMALSMLSALIISLSCIYLLIDSGDLVLNTGKVGIFAGLFGVLVCTALLSFSYSHRIVGPLFTTRRCIDMLSEDKDIIEGGCSSNILQHPRSNCI